MNTEAIEAARSVEAAKRLARGETSRARRALYGFLLLLDAGAVVMTVALWTTEPSLPLRTHVAFAALLALALAWLVFLTWVLSVRKPLYALDRVTAGRLAVAGTTLFLLGGVALAAGRGDWQAVATVAAVGSTLVAAAAALLIQATRLHRELLQRRDTLAALAASNG